MKRDDWPVGAFGIRPAGSPDHCFYCGQPRNAQHEPNCVIRERTVVVEMTVRYVITVPEFWTAEDIEFHRNDGTWCAINGLAEINDLDERLNQNGEIEDCFCDRTHYKYLREATIQDEDRDAISVVRSRS